MTQPRAPIIIGGELSLSVQMIANLAKRQLTTEQLIDLVVQIEDIIASRELAPRDHLIDERTRAE